MTKINVILGVLVVCAIFFVSVPIVSRGEKVEQYTSVLLGFLLFITIACVCLLCFDPLSLIFIQGEGQIRRQLLGL